MQKVAIITGAGSGIGLGLARRLVSEGKAVLGVGRDASRLAGLEKELGTELVATLAIDITQGNAPRQIVDLAVERWGRIDIIVNNAGLGRPRALGDTDDEMLDAFLSLMLRAPFRLIRAALPHMASGSAIINVSSTFAMVGGMNGGAYSAAKAGMSGLTTHIAAAYGAQGIRCNAVAPGVIPTPMTEGRWDDPIFIKMNNHMTPSPRLGTVEDVVATIAFLVSNEAAFINGQILAVDGGWSSTKYLSQFALTADWKEPA